MKIMPVSKKAVNIILAALFFIFSSCGGDNNNPEDEFGLDATDTMSVPSGASQEMISEIIESLPSPLEISLLIKETGNEYNSNILNSTDNASNYSTSNKKAFAMGVYGTDLGYINIYEKTFASLDYLNEIKDLADAIKVGQFFDFETLKRLSKNSKNADSLLLISTQGLNDMDAYLRKQNRGKLSILMVSGGWLEALYIVSQIAESKPNNDLKERVGEQKEILANLLVLLDNYKNDPYVENIIKEFKTIEQEYATITVTTEYKEPETKEVDGMMVVVDNSASSVNITENQLASITNTVELVRNNLIK